MVSIFFVKIKLRKLKKDVMLANPVGKFITRTFFIEETIWKSEIKILNFELNFKLACSHCRNSFFCALLDNFWTLILYFVHLNPIWKKILVIKSSASKYTASPYIIFKINCWRMILTYICCSIISTTNIKILVNLAHFNIILFFIPYHILIIFHGTYDYISQALSFYPSMLLHHLIIIFEYLYWNFFNIVQQINLFVLLNLSITSVFWI